MGRERRLKFERLRRLAFVISFGIAAVGAVLLPGYWIKGYYLYILWGWFILHSVIDLAYEKSTFYIGKLCFAVIGFIVVILVLGSQI